MYRLETVNYDLRTPHSIRVGGCLGFHLIYDLMERDWSPRSKVALEFSYGAVPPAGPEEDKAYDFCAEWGRKAWEAGVKHINIGGHF